MAGTNTWLVVSDRGYRLTTSCMMYNGATGRYIAQYSAATKLPSDLSNIIPVAKSTNTR